MNPAPESYVKLVEFLELGILEEFTDFFLKLHLI